MLTEEQKQKAEEALNPFYKLPMFQNFEKEIAFRNHQTAIAWIDLYNLPYRVSLDYLKQYDPDNGFVRINLNYPYPGYRKDSLIHLREDEIIIGYDLDMTPREETTRQKIKECCDKLCPWNLQKAAGRKQWEYYFAHFLNAAQLNAFTWFDWFGEKSAPNEVAKKNQQDRIKYWLSLQKKYRKRPDDYMQEEPLQSSYDLEEYTQLEFVPEWGIESTQYRGNEK